MNKAKTPGEFDEDGELLESTVPDANKGKRRSRTVARREMYRDRAKFQEDPKILAELESIRPKKRGDCLGGQRPCIFVGCENHLYLDVSPETGSIKLNFPDKEVWELQETCALDVADRGGITLEEVGSILNLTRERIRQMEVVGLKAMQKLTGSDGDDLAFDDGRIERARERSHRRQGRAYPPNGVPPPLEKIMADVRASAEKLKAAFATPPAPSPPASPDSDSSGRTATRGDFDFGI